jgi:hypothetical protein
MKRKINHQVTLSSSEVHASIGRAKYARLLNIENDRPLVVRAALKEFLLHGAKYAFPATLGSPAHGIPTAYAAPPLVTLVSQPNELPPVCPTPRAISAASLFTRFIQPHRSPHERIGWFMNFSHCLTHCVAALRENDNSPLEY